MATREEITKGLEFTVAQAKRTTALYAEGEWDWKRESGWTPKEIFSHLTATAGIVPQFAQGMAALPEDQDMAKGIDINGLNAQGVDAMASMTPEQIMQAFEASYDKLIEFVNAAPDETWSMKRSFLSEPVPVSDIMASSIMLHGLHHVYEAYARPIG